MHLVRGGGGAERGDAGIEERGGAGADVPAQKHRRAPVRAAGEDARKAVRHQGRVAAEGAARARRGGGHGDEGGEHRRVGRALSCGALRKEGQESFLDLGSGREEGVVSRGGARRRVKDVRGAGNDCHDGAG